MLAGAVEPRERRDRSASSRAARPTGRCGPATARSRDAAWSYKSPSPSFAPIRDHYAFYAGQMDACYVDGELVVPQPGGFYGGWITSRVAGPFKGSPGSRGW